MWYARCHFDSTLHVENMARERIIIHLRNYHNLFLSEEEIKEKVLEILKSSSKKEQIECDKNSNIPKYKLYGILPGTRLFICLYILEYKEDLCREVKTIIDQHDIMFNKKVQKELLDQKKKTEKRYKENIKKKSRKR